MSENTKSLPTTPATTTAPRFSRAGLGSGVGLLILYVLMVLVISQLSPFFLGPRNLVNLPVSVAVIGMIAIFSTMLMIGGGLDLSVGAVTALVGVVVASTQTQFGVWGAAAFGLLIGLIVGFLNGVLVTRVGINPLITTLGMLSTVRGLAFVFSGGLSIPMLDKDFAQLGRGNIAGVPTIIIAVVIMFIIGVIVMHFTTYGRAMYAIGGNSRASHLAGLPVKRYQMIAYILSGVSAAVAGLFLTSRLGVGAPQASTGLELKVVAAIILGGTSLTGGKGNLFGTLLGVLILGTLDNAMTLLSVNAYYQQIGLGVILLLAVGLDQLRVGNLGRLLRSKY
ncbi:MAG: ABC transporter permease [Anaerolineae bacterium]|nr:ABC transporter permease [Anaerolineae bacterium]